MQQGGLIGKVEAAISHWDELYRATLAAYGPNDDLTVFYAAKLISAQTTSMELSAIVAEVMAS